jgi:hypothetical protein
VRRSGAIPAYILRRPNCFANIGCQPLTASFTFSDVNGYNYIGQAQGYFNSAQTWVGACGFSYDSATNSIRLNNDAGSGRTVPIVLGTTGILENSKCTLHAQASGTVASANNLTLVVTLDFKPGFAGLKRIFGAAQDVSGLDSGFTQLGHWFVGNLQDGIWPTVISVAPNSGTGRSQLFSFQYSDGNGYLFLGSAITFINSSLNSALSCGIYYQQESNNISVVNDAGTGWVGTMVLGSPGTLQNSQCSVDVGASSASGSGNILTLNVSLTFKPGARFSGQQTIFSKVLDIVGRDCCGTYPSLGTWDVQLISVTELEDCLEHSVSILKIDCSALDPMKRASDGRL